MPVPRGPVCASTMLLWLSRADSKEWLKTYNSTLSNCSEFLVRDLLTLLKVSRREMGILDDPGILSGLVVDRSLFAGSGKRPKGEGRRGGEGGGGRRKERRKRKTRSTAR